MAVLTVNIFIFSQSNDDRFVNKVFFIGNEKLNNSSLFNQIELKPSNILLFSKPTFDRRLLKLDAISLKNYYNSEGFLEVSVKDSFAISPVFVSIPPYFSILTLFLTSTSLISSQSNHEWFLLGLILGLSYLYN